MKNLWIRLAFALVALATVALADRAATQEERTAPDSAGRYEATTPGQAPLGPRAPACRIEDWRWKYNTNQFADGGGYIEVDGVVADYPVGPLGMPEIHVRFYDKVGETETYLGKDMDFIRASTFDVSIESRRPRGSLLIKWSCLP